MYEAFGRGDVTAILSSLSEDVTWDVTDEPWTPHAAGVPWLRPRRGHAEVAEFFAIVSAWKYERFELLDLLASQTQVAAEMRMIAELPNGKRIDEVVIHLWTFGDDGRVIALRRMLDTAANIAAADPY
jgi:ketosteroid isomerase-like protein